MTPDETGADLYYPPVLDPDRLQRRKEWEVKRARGHRSDGSERPADYTPIVFPDCPGLCQAARVVAGRMAAAEPDLLDAIIATDELLRMLGIIDVMNNGGDGRQVKVQRGPVKLHSDGDEPAPLGYAEEDLGRPIAKPKPKKQRTERRNHRAGL